MSFLLLWKGFNLHFVFFHLCINLAWDLKSNSKHLNFSNNKILVFKIWKLMWCLFQMLFKRPAGLEICFKFSTINWMTDLIYFQLQTYKVKTTIEDCEACNQENWFLMTSPQNGTKVNWWPLEKEWHCS